MDDPRPSWRFKPLWLAKMSSLDRAILLQRLGPPAATELAAVLWQTLLLCTQPAPSVTAQRVHIAPLDDLSCWSGGRQLRLTPL